MAEVSEQEDSVQEEQPEQQEVPADAQPEQQSEQPPAQEASEQPPQEQPDEQSDQAPNAQPEQPEPSQEPLDEETAEQEDPEEPEEPRELAELTELVSVLSSLSSLCERTQQRIDADARPQTQEALQQYASGLAYIPKALQLLHDYRRFKPSFDERAQALHDGLLAARKDDDALSSEEQRVIAAAASLRETISASVGALEHALAYVRSHTQHLLALIAYDDGDFDEHAQHLLAQIDVSMVSRVAHQEYRRALQLKRDVVELRALEEHLEGLTAEEEDA